MPTPHARSSGRRSGRGPRRDRDRDRDHRHDEPRDSRSTPPAPKSEPKLSLWQKIVGLLTGKKEKPSAPESRRPQGENRDRDRPRATVTSNYPAQSAPRTVRKPEALEATTPKLYVGNLSFDASESDLSELFNGVGAVQLAEIVSHKDTFRSKGFGFVTMGSVEEAKRAVTELHDKEFMGRKLVVSGAKTPPER